MSINYKNKLIFIVKQRIYYSYYLYYNKCGYNKASNEGLTNRGIFGV